MTEIKFIENITLINGTNILSDTIAIILEKNTVNELYVTANAGDLAAIIKLVITGR